METKYQIRKRELLDECTIAPEIFEQVTQRLEQFMAPYVAHLARREQIQHSQTFMQGLLSDLARKNVESIAYRFGQARMPLQWFIGVSDWDDRAWRQVLVDQVGQHLGEADGVLVFDPSAFPKSGGESVGVKRQWCGRLGKIENGQVAVYMGYVSSEEHALVDRRLFLPKEWTQDQKRRQKAGVPKEVRYKTRHQLCLDMLKAHGHTLAHQWITGDDEMGRPYWFRLHLDGLSETYLLAVPSDTLVRDLEADLPARKRKPPWQRVDQWMVSCGKDAFTEVDVRDGAKGPLLVEVAKRRVIGRTHRRQEGHKEGLVVIRYIDRDDQQVLKTDYYLSNATPNTDVATFARVAKAEHRIEECIQRAKSQAGLADYEVRNWKGWHHHQTLSLMATWFLVQEARRGKKMDPGDHRAANPPGDRHDIAPPLRMRYTIAHHDRT